MTAPLSLEDVSPRRRGLSALMPKGLYTRSLLIVVLPMLLLQSVVALIFLERHWELTTRRLSGAVAQEIAALLDLNEAFPSAADRAVLVSMARRDLGIQAEFLPDQPLPPPAPSRPFLIVEGVLSNEIARRTDKPFWIDATSARREIEVRIKLNTEVLQLRVPLNRAYALNSHIFLIWMSVASIILITVSILFLRNQIRPILQLAKAAENLGKGREVAQFPVRGALEVRRATQAFFAMRDRIERQIEQRTTMLAGVSHDLRTVLTRLRLQIALMPQRQEARDMEADVNEMERMLAGYLAFVRGDAGETARPFDVSALLTEVGGDAERTGRKIDLSFTGDPMVTARPDALKRAVSNLAENAYRFAQNVRVQCRHESGQLVIIVDDDGPGIPADQREDVFRPFLRLDQARNLNHPGSGLGLTIARDVARGHGGDVDLSTSPLGGLRARLHIPA